jgi:hypothetical protein
LQKDVKWIVKGCQQDCKRIAKGCQKDLQNDCERMSK